MLAKKPKGATEKRRKSSGLSGLLWMLFGAILTLMIGVFLYLSPVFNFDPAKQSTNTQSERQVQPKVSTDTDNNDYEFYDVLPNQEMATIPEGAVTVDTSGDVPKMFEPDVVVTEDEVADKQATDEGNFGISEDTILKPQPTQDPTDDTLSDDEIIVVEDDTTYDGDDANSARTPAPEQESLPPITYILQINSFSNADEADRRRAQVLMAGVDAKVVKRMTANGEPLYQVISKTMTNRQAVSNAQQRLQNNGIDSLIVEQRR